MKAAERAAPGSVLLAMLPDTGERYLGTYLFDDLNAGSDDEWLASLDKNEAACAARRGSIWELAEREGFEPSKGFWPSHP